MMRRVCLLLILLWTHANAAVQGSLGDVADGLYALLAAGSQALSYVLLIVGVCFCLGALLQYKNHRRNPSQVRLSTPFFYLVLGVLSLLLPFVYFIVGYDPGVSLT